MSKKRRHQKTYEYSCTMTGETFKTHREAAHPNELVSVKAYYELHPEKDDRPEPVKMQLQMEEELAKSAEARMDLLAEKESEKNKQ